MLGSNIKTHDAVKRAVDEILNMSSGMTPADVYVLSSTIQQTAERILQVAMFEEQLAAAAKADHQDLAYKNILVVLNTVNQNIPKENLTTREGLSARYSHLLSGWEHIDPKQREIHLTELLLWLDPIDTKPTQSIWAKLFGWAKPKAKETKPVDNINTGLVNN